MRETVSERLVLIFLIDALGYTQAGSPAFLPEFDALRRPVRSVLGYSSAALPTLMSGLRPEEHGHLSMYRRARQDGVFTGLDWWLRPLSGVTGRHWTLRKWAAASLRRAGITGYFSLYDVPLNLLSRFDLSQRQDVFSPGGFGERLGLADLVSTAGGRLWNWTVPQARAFAELAEEIERGERPVLFLYSAELDATMHAHGPRGAATTACLTSLERRMRDLLVAARRRYREVRAFAFGDHGMAEVSATHDLWSRLGRLGLSAPRDYLFFLDSTMARFWFANDAARRAVLGLLAELPYGRLLEEPELRAERAWFPDADYGEAIFLLREGEILLPSFMSAQPVQGMHGYHPDDASMYTTLLSTCHDVEPPSDLVGIHALLRREIESIGRAG